MRNNMKKSLRIIFNVSFIVYLIVLMFLLFLNSRNYFWMQDMSLLNYFKQTTNLVPFKTISTYIKALFDQTMNIDIPIKNLVGNLIMFLPMGIYLPTFIKKLKRVGLFSLSMFSLLVIIEVLQLLTRRGSLDIDDFILNMFGALLGLSLWKKKSFQKFLINLFDK